MEQTPVTVQYTGHEGVTLSGEAWGDESHPPVILLHGGGQTRFAWGGTARALAQAGWYAVSLDLRGHGDSAWSPDGAYASAYMVGDLLAFMRHLGDGPVAIVAHSLGAALSLRYAGIFPDNVRRLAAIEGIGLDGFSAPKPVESRWGDFLDRRIRLDGMTPRHYPRLDDALARMRQANPHLGEDLARHLTIHGVTGDEDGGFRWKYDPYITALYPDDLSDEERFALWRRIDCPVWLVHGADSWARHPSEGDRLAQFRDPRVTSFEGAGHWVQHDRFDDFVAELRDFLK